jgi:hypothetical protein
VPPHKYAVLEGLVSVQTISDLNTPEDVSSLGNPEG